MENIYKPHLMEITDIWIETPTVITFRLEFLDEELKRNFTFKPGQFGEFSVFGEGEATFVISTSPTREGYIDCSVKKVGRLTNALHKLDTGDIVGFRGPYGNWFDVDAYKGKDILFIGGGIGLAPLRSVIQYCFDKRDDYKDIEIMYAARNLDELVYKRELEEWGGRDDCTQILAVDPGGETPDWEGRVSFIPPILDEEKPAPEGKMVITCGPPIMIKLVIEKLLELNFTPEQIITTLEMKMKCGLGKCGRCNIGDVYVCKDGPVFSYEELMKLPQEY